MATKYSVNVGFKPGIIVAAVIAVVLCFFIIQLPLLIGVVSLFLGFYSFKQVTGYTLSSIIITFENDSVTFVNRDLIGREEQETYPREVLYFTYRKRTIRGNWGTVPQVQVRNVCIIDCKQKTLAVLEPDKDGWADGSISMVVKDMTALGIKRITEKYSDKEVDI